MLNRNQTTVEDREDGASMVEYALLIVLIAVIALVAIVLAGETISTTFSNIANSLTTS